MVMNDMQDDGKWGAVIAVDGKRPEWLEAGPQPILLHNSVGWHTFNCENVDPAKVGWAFTSDGRPNVDIIRLPADHPHYRQGQGVDWSRPIEAVHEDGRVVAVAFVEDDGSDELSMLIKPESEMIDINRGSARYFNRDGTRTTKGWRIRNVQPATQAPDAQTLTAQERLERMEALVREMAAQAGPEPRFIERARALVAAMEPVVDADVIAVRKIMHAQQRAMTPPNSGWGNMSYLKGSYDDTEPFKAALVAYREQRP